MKDKEPPMMKSYPVRDRETSVVQSSVERSKTRPKGGVFRNFISNLVQKSFVEGAKQQDLPSDEADFPEDEWGDITIDMYTTTELEGSPDPVTTPTYFPTSSEQQPTTPDPFRFNPTSTTISDTEVEEEEVENGNSNHGWTSGIEKISKPKGAIGWQHFNMHDGFRPGNNLKTPEEKISQRRPNIGQRTKGSFDRMFDQLKPPPMTNTFSVWENDNKIFTT